MDPRVESEAFGKEAFESGGGKGLEKNGGAKGRKPKKEKPQRGQQASRRERKAEKSGEGDPKAPDPGGEGLPGLWNKT